jgi:zinc transporter ZupT
MLEVNVFTVVLAATLTAVATGLGALPFLAFRRPARSWLGVSNALAGGAMLGASVGLVVKGVSAGPVRTALGAVLGAAFIAVTSRALGHRRHGAFGEFGEADALKALMIVGVMTVHSFTEGVGVGVSFGGGEALGTLITIAIALHNVPEGLAISLVLIPRGVRPLTAAGWSVFSSLPQPLMAVPAYVFVELFEPLLPVGLGFAAGAMVWMVARQLVPEALEQASVRSVALGVALAGGLMIGAQALVDAV